MKVNKLFIILTLIIVLLVSSVIATAPDDGLSLWDFEDGSGTTLTDIWGGNDGVISANAGFFSSTVPSYHTSGSGGSYSGYFDGTDNVAIPDYLESNEVSICFWFQRTSENAGYMIDKRVGGSTGYFVYDYGDAGKMQFGFKDGSNNLYVTKDSVGYTSLSTWYHFCMVKDDNTLTLYKDGVEDGDFTTTFNDYSNAGALNLGSNILEGYIDNFKIIDRAITITEVENDYNYGNTCGDSGCGDTGNHSLETVVLIEQVSPVKVNSNTYQLVSSGSFTPVNSTNATISGVIEIESSKDLSMGCKILVNDTDYNTEVNRTFDSANTGNLYMVSEVFELPQNNSVKLELWCRRTSLTGGNIIIDKGIGITHLLVDSNGNNINYAHLNQDFETNTSNYRLLLNTSFLTSNTSAVGLSRQLVFDGRINYDFDSASLIELYSMVNGVMSPVFNRYGTASSIGNGGNFNIAYNLSNETSVPVLLYGRSSSADGSVNVNLNIKEMVGHQGMFNVSVLNSTSLSSTSWATAKKIVINNSEHATGDIVVKASPSTISTSGDQVVTYRLYYNGSAYSPEYERNIIDAGTGVSTLEYVFHNIGTGLFNIELQYKVESNAEIRGGSIISYLVGDITPFSNDFEVTASNFWNDSAILNFSVSLGSGSIIFYSNVSSGIAMITSSINPNDIAVSNQFHFNKTYTDWNTSNDLSAELYQSIIWVNITERFSGNPISNWALTNGSETLINTTSNVDVSYPNAGEYNNLVLYSNTGAFSDRNLDGFNVSLFEQNTIYYELLPTELNITTESIISGLGINNFSMTYSSLNNSHTDTFSTTDGDIVFGVINGDTYNITVNAPGYALFNNSAEVVISGNTAKKFYLYTNNSISFEVRWEDNNTLIDQFTDTILAGAVATYNFNTSNGSLYVDNLIDDVYSIKTVLNNTIKYYSVVVGDSSHQDLTVYFSTGYENVTFLIQDKITGSALEDVYFSMSRYINGTMTVVSSKLSDITGSVSAKYVLETFYQMTAVKSGYADKTFELNPIDSATYIVKMESSASKVLIDDGVSFYYSPKTFSVDNNSITAVLLSPLGLLNSYWINVSYPGGYDFVSGSESIGETFYVDFTVINPGIYDFVRVEYNYSTTVGDGGSGIFYHPISFVNASSNSWDGMRDGYSDLGIFDRIMIVILVIILLSGFGYLVGGLTGSLVTGLLGYAFFLATGFLPFWSIAITLFAGVVLLIRGGTFG